MAKEFNITGNCRPNRHFMADTRAKMEGVMELVTKGKYFTMNRPRQYGKTTTLFALFDALAASEEYLAFKISFEGVGDEVFKTEPAFAKMVFEQMERNAEGQGNLEIAAFLSEQRKQIETFNDLSKSITELTRQTDRKLVLLIDEVDKSSNSQLFVSFLAMLRDKYLNSDSPSQRTFHSIVLVGVHDVKTLKAKLRPGEQASFNSPWNIAADFKVDMSFRPHEIVPMLEDFMAERGVTMDAPAVAERLFYYTSGYPFLVSKLCKMLDEDDVPGVLPGEWKSEDVETAVKLLVKESNANFDSLTKNLEDTPELYELTQTVLLNEDITPFNPHNTSVILGIAYGVFALDGGISGSLRIHNRVYQEVIANYMDFKMYLAIRADTKGATFQGRYVLSDHQLDLPAVLLAFQLFMREEHSQKDEKFLERQGRLIFLAFLKPILNGGGFAFKEPQISEEKRLDLLITFFQHRYLLELKVWYGEVAHQKGLLQLADYLDRQHLGTGYLLIFDHTRKNVDRAEWLKAGEKEVYAVWV